MYVRKDDLVDSFLRTGQQTWLVPSPPPDSGRQHPSEKTEGGKIGSVETGLKSLGRTSQRIHPSFGIHVHECTGP